MNIEWSDYQKFVTNLSTNYPVHRSYREIPVLTQGISEELNEVAEAVYNSLANPGNRDYQSLVNVEIGDCLAYMMIAASWFGVDADDIVKASIGHNWSYEQALINAHKVSGFFKRFYRGDYLLNGRDNYEFSALNMLCVDERFQINLIAQFGAVFYYLQKVAFDFNLCMDAIKAANMSKGVYLAEKAKK